MSKAKLETDRRWRQRNPEKVRAYTAKYAEGKTKVSVTLDNWIAEEIAKIKPPEQPLGGWIRERLEKWAEVSKTKTSRNSDDIF
ncbi:hypothetical protein WA1_33365 [Scytonema hofmannii PCC 7110]|uniref:CopG family transcriptional regulator n=1 Tax=Scytonema hofmannii PCC 7110 TaxID=128403 RepID=A0A139X2J9_9CYAN|nr:hypothetical protein [Scytonema hofmannii]KYC38904.1 hypothetical protein WA1_33365 [Scytonema hofmannii PCC 7110]